MPSRDATEVAPPGGEGRGNIRDRSVMFTRYVPVVCIQDGSVAIRRDLTVVIVRDLSLGLIQDSFAGCGNASE